MRNSQRLQSMVVGLVFTFVATCGLVRAESRTWTDATGKFKIDAELVEATDEHVVLQKADGKTVKVPLAKLCAEDQKFIADQQAAMFGEATTEEGAETPAEPAATTEETDATGEDETSADPANDKVATRKVVTQFFDGLRKPDKKPLAAILTQAAKEKIADGSSPVLNLPKPESKSTTKVGSATIDGDEATVSVKLRVEGKNNQAKVSLRREGKSWKIWSMSLTPTGSEPGTETLANFETGESTVPPPTAVAGESAGGGSAPKAPGVGGISTLGPGLGVGPPPGSDPAPMEEGTGTEEEPAAEPQAATGDNPKELLNSIEALRNDPRIKQDRQFATESFQTIAVAAEKILDLENATKPQRTAAIKHQFEALTALGQLGVPNLGKRIESLAGHVEKYGPKEMARPVEALTLQLKVQGAKTPAALTAAVAKVEEFLAAGPIGPQEAMLANSAAQVVEQMQRRGMDSDDVAAAMESLAGPLASSRVPQIAQLGEQLMGKARRLGLVGKPMELAGFTVDGKPLDMSQFEGKVVLVDFWATWCGPCMAELPNVRANYDQYHEQGFDVIAISIDDNQEALRKYVTEQQPPWTVVADSHKKSSGKSMADYYGVNSIPCTILIGRDGNVVALNVRGEALGRELAKLMANGG